MTLCERCRCEVARGVRSEATRERDIRIEAMSRSGLTNAVIASRLRITERTVERARARRRRDTM